MAVNVKEIMLPPEAIELTNDMISIQDVETIVLQHQKPIIHFIYRIINNQELALDLTQDVFLKLYKALLNDIKIPKKALNGWLYKVALNTATDAYRRLRRIVWQSLNDVDDDDERPVLVYKPLSEYYGYHNSGFEDAIAEREIIEQVLAQMPEKNIVCLWLFENDGFSLPEIAEILHVSYAAAKMRLMRSRNQFIELYEDENNRH